MTHFANQGKPTGELFKGYFASVARNTRALLARNQVDGPVYLIGGPARIRSFQQAFAEPGRGGGAFARALSLLRGRGSRGYRAEQIAAGRPGALPEDPGDLVRDRGEALHRAGAGRPVAGTRDDPARGRVERRKLPPRPAVLGLDLGSTGAKAVLTDPWRRASRCSTSTTRPGATRSTRPTARDGDPRARASPDVRAIGVTGSGRKAVATLLRAVFPEIGASS